MKQLDADVMETICASIDNIYDLLTLTRASSGMWQIGIREVLRNHTIRLTSRKAIHSFRGFVLNRESTCAQHLRSLVIPSTTWATPVHETRHPSEDNEQVMDILERAAYLDSLNLSLDGPHPDILRVSSAFSTLKALRHLSLTELLVAGDGSWIPHALRALRLPPITLCIYQSRSLPRVLESVLSPNLSHFANPSTLTNLLLPCVPMYDDSFLGVPRFCSVRSLTITQPLPREPKLDALLHLFPSLDGILRLCVDPWKVWDITSTHPQRLAKIRAANVRAQSAFRWTKLDRLDCDFSTVMMLALQCPVRHLTMECFDIPTLVGVQPRHGSPFDYYDISEPLPDAPDPISTTHVVLITSCQGQKYEDANGNVRRDAVLSRALHPLSAFPHTTHARLVLHCYADCTCDLGAEVDDLVHNSRDAATSSTPLARVLASYPRMRCFMLTVIKHDETNLKPDPSHQQWARTRAWRVVANGCETQEHIREGSEGGGGRPKFEELSSYEAKRVIEDEEIGLPEWGRDLEGV